MIARLQSSFVSVISIKFHGNLPIPFQLHIQTSSHLQTQDKNIIVVSCSLLHLSGSSLDSLAKFVPHLSLANQLGFHLHERS